MRARSRSASSTHESFHTTAEAYQQQRSIIKTSPGTSCATAISFQTAHNFYQCPHGTRAPYHLKLPLVSLTLIASHLPAPFSQCQLFPRPRRTSCNRWKETTRNGSEEDRILFHGERICMCASPAEFCSGPTKERTLLKHWVPMEAWRMCLLSGCGWLRIKGLWAWYGRFRGYQWRAEEVKVLILIISILLMLLHSRTYVPKRKKRVLPLLQSESMGYIRPPTVTSHQLRCNAMLCYHD